MRYFFVVSSFLVILGASAQSTIHNITHNGVEREYRLYVPDIYSGVEPVPLVFNLHGYTSNAIQQEFYGDFRPIADTANFILVHPEGLNDFGGSQFWNAFGVSGIDDVGFISAMIGTLSAEYNIDPQCVYSTGMSNGGFMSFELACMLSDRIAAVASVTGAMAENRLAVCNPEFARPTMQIHGTQDATVPYSGNAEWAPIPDVIDFWVELNGCDETPEITDVPDIDPEDGTTTEHFVYANDQNGNTVEHYKVQNGGHTWPGAPIAIGATSYDFDASVEIWRFFRQHKMDDPTSVSNPAEDLNFSVYPNPSTGIVNVDFDEMIDHIRLVDFTGRTVQEWSGSRTNYQLSVAHSGVYFIQVESRNRLAAQKFVVH